MLKTLDRAPVKNKRILLRVGYDFTLKKENGKWKVADDARIRETIPTINYLIEQGCSIVLMSYLGRPKPGTKDEQFSMDAVGLRLSSLLAREVKKLDETVGPEVERAVNALKTGEIILLENTRFNAGETEADPKLAAAMARLGEYLVFDAFAQSMRVHASTTGILSEHRSTSCAGLLMQKECSVLGQILENPMEPFVVVLGGAKVSDKIAMVRNILDKAAMILIGGALAHPFFKASGLPVGGSLIESVFVDEAKGVSFNPIEIARDLLKETRASEVPRELVPELWPNNEKMQLSKVQLPFDVVVASKNASGFKNEEIAIKKINANTNLCSENEAILDIGPFTASVYGEIIKRARTIFWNGPMGYFENFNFQTGTKTVAESIAKSKAFSIIGGGDTEAVVAKFRLDGRFGHISTGGGASLSLLAGERFPVMEYLEE